MTDALDEQKPLWVDERLLEKESEKASKSFHSNRLKETKT